MHVYEGRIFLYRIKVAKKIDTSNILIIIGHRARLLHFFIMILAFAREKVLGERVQHVNTEAQVAPADGNVHGDDLELVGLVDLQRRLQHVKEVGQLRVPKNGEID